MIYPQKKVAMDPKLFGEPLKDNLMGLWKFCVGDYRIIADIQEQKIVVVVVRIGHGRKVYRFDPNT